jgi:hypothetical protein
MFENSMDILKVKFRNIKQRSLPPHALTVCLPKIEASPVCHNKKLLRP